MQAFLAVGATRPVDLDDQGKSIVLEVLGGWLAQADGAGLPAELAELRERLLDDLDASGFWRR